MAPETLYRWKKEHFADPTQSFPGNGNLKDRDKEVEQLKRENSRLNAENALRVGDSIRSTEPDRPAPPPQPHPNRESRVAAGGAGNPGDKLPPSTTRCPPHPDPQARPSHLRTRRGRRETVLTPDPDALRVNAGRHLSAPVVTRPRPVTPSSRQAAPAAPSPRADRSRQSCEGTPAADPRRRPPGSPTRSSSPPDTADTAADRPRRSVA